MFKSLNARTRLKGGLFGFVTVAVVWLILALTVHIGSIPTNNGDTVHSKSPQPQGIVTDFSSLLGHRVLFVNGYLGIPDGLSEYGKLPQPVLLPIPSATTPPSLIATQSTDSLTVTSICYVPKTKKLYYGVTGSLPPYLRNVDTSQWLSLLPIQDQQTIGAHCTEGSVTDFIRMINVHVNPE